MYKAIYYSSCHNWKASGRYSRSHTCSGVRFSHLSNSHHMSPWLYIGMWVFSLILQAQTTDSQSCRRSFAMFPGQLQSCFSQTMNSILSTEIYCHAWIQDGILCSRATGQHPSAIISIMVCWTCQKPRSCWLYLKSAGLVSFGTRCCRTPLHAITIFCSDQYC